MVNELELDVYLYYCHQSSSVNEIVIVTQWDHTSQRVINDQHYCMTPVVNTTVLHQHYVSIV